MITSMTLELEHYFDRLWPLTRSLTGNGNRETLRILSEIIPLTIHEIPSGTVCYDWVVPPEWNPTKAWIKDSKGNVIVDVNDNNLHLLGYSQPYRGSLTFNELSTHLYTLPETPDRIPYVVSYYEPRWGFCISQNQFDALDRHEHYEVCIEATHDEAGSMTYGDYVLAGKTTEEVLISTYICHPSMANDQITGMLVAAFLYRELANIPDRHYTYRFVFAPETIGALAYLNTHGTDMKANTVAGFVLTCLGDAGNFTYKQTKQPNTLTNRATMQALNDFGVGYKSIPFSPRGSDERQYASPGFNLPVGSLMRSMHGTFSEYHSSADNKSFISFRALTQSLYVYFRTMTYIEHNHRYINTHPYGEVQLGKRGLYPTLGRGNDKSEFVDAMVWLLNYSDGKHDMLDIAALSGLPMTLLIEAARTLQEHNLIVVDDD